MCQAYEGERAAIVAGENYATKQGFKAAATGGKLEDNPDKWSIYSGNAWYHGFACWMSGLLPWAIERELERGTGQRTANTFRQTGELPTSLLQELGIPAGAVSPLQRDFEAPHITH